MNDYHVLLEVSLSIVGRVKADSQEQAAEAATSWFDNHSESIIADVADAYDIVVVNTEPVATSAFSADFEVHDGAT